MAIKLNLNQTTFVKTIAQRVYRNGGLTVAQSMAVGQSLFLSSSLLDDEDGMFAIEVADVFARSSDAVVIVATNTKVDVDTNIDVILELVKASLVTADGNPTDTLLNIGKQAEAFYPSVAGSSIERRFNKGKKRSKLMNRAIEVLESTQFTVDTTILNVAKQVFCQRDENGQPILNHLGGLMSKDRYEDKFIIDACSFIVKGITDEDALIQGVETVLPNAPRCSEFKPDKRGRLYQAACHGANGQSSDMARALQNLHGVPQTYDIDKAIVVLLAEMDDMIGGKFSIEDLLAFMRTKGHVQTIIDCVDYKRRKANGDDVSMHSKETGAIKKPWSFFKAAIILNKLRNGEKPYIGMAFGLDAKCSGPQLGALMSADANIAAACGFANVVTEDAYVRCINVLSTFGILSRDAMKKPYMGVFYGQSMRAFCDMNEYAGYGDETTKKVHSKELGDFIVNMNAPINTSLVGIVNEFLTCGRATDLQIVSNAAAFHACIEESFGRMQMVRNEFKSAHGMRDKETGETIYYTDSKKPVGHFMPDGFKITMNEKLNYDINDEVVIKKGLDVRLGATYFEELTLQSEVVDQNYQQRTGFVNLIQGTDALLARCITANLGDANVQHVIAVHDCFRVNICDMIDGKLHGALELSYAQIFTEIDCKWFDGKDLVVGIHNRDILALYFAGVKNSYAEEFKTINTTPVTQFALNGVRKFTSVKGNKIVDLISNLRNELDDQGASYYFAK